MQSEEVLKEFQSAILNKTVHFTEYHQHAIHKMTLCRTISKGGQIGQCIACGALEVLYNPCNQRGCPVCHQKNQILWEQKIKDKIIPDSHYHYIVSVPKELTPLWFTNKKEFISVFYKSLRKTFKKQEKISGLTHGTTMVFQSHGRGLSYKPHIHCLVTQKGLNRNGEWILGSAIKSSWFEDEFRTFFCHELKKSFPDYCTEKVSDSNEWRIFTELHNHTGDHIINYLSHSVSGVVTDFENIEISHDKDEVVVTDFCRGEKIITCLKISTFIERYINHIPEKGCVVIRHYGIYATRKENELKKIKEENYDCQSSGSAEEEITTCTLCNNRLQIKQVFRAGEYPVIIKKFIKHHGRPPLHGEVIKN